MAQYDLATLERYAIPVAEHSQPAAVASWLRVAVTETGERVPGKPSNSYRNILRAGFEEAYVRQNYLSPSTPG